MKCSRLTLFDRRDKHAKQPKHSCSHQRHCPPIEPHNYVSWLNKPHAIADDEQQYLTVYNLVMPKDAPTLADRGARSDRWANKRPRLKSARPRAADCPGGDGGSACSEQDSELMEMQQVAEEYDIDENVQRLILEAAEYDMRMQNSGTAEDKDGASDEDKKSKLRAKKEKFRKSKTITLSLSRPPSPETVQVIRVDVTSNFSIDDSCGSTTSDGSSTYSGKNDADNVRLEDEKNLIKNCPDLQVSCQRVELTNRK